MDIYRWRIVYGDDLKVYSRGLLGIDGHKSYWRTSELGLREVHTVTWGQEVLRLAMLNKLNDYTPRYEFEKIK